MLPKTWRLTRESDFSRIYKRGRRAASKHLQIFFLPRTDQNSPRFGFVISKKSAVKIARRNRIKRLLRAETGSLVKTRTLRPLDVIVQGRAGISSLPDEEIRAEARELMRKLVK